MDFDIQLFHSDELEHGVIASLLYNQNALAEVMDAGLTVNDFYNVRYRLCWDSVIRSWNAGTVWDWQILQNDLQGRLDGDVYVFMGQIGDGKFLTQNAATYARRLRELTMRRDGVTFAERTSQAYSNFENDVLDVHSGMLTEATNIGMKLAVRPSHVGALSAENMSKYANIEAGFVAPAVMTTPFVDLNMKLSPIERGQLIVVAAREKTGKTRFMLQNCTHAALNGLKVFYVSCEMQKHALQGIAAQMLSRVNATRMQTRKLTQEERERFFDAHRHITKTDFWIEDRARDIAAIRNICLKMKHEVGVDVIAVDYLTKIQGDYRLKTRQQQIAQISATLAYLAIECDCVLWLGSQVNKEGDTREAMDTQQDADKIIKLKRDDADGEFSDSTSVAITQREGLSFGFGANTKLRFNVNAACYESIADENVRQLQDKENGSPF